MSDNPQKHDRELSEAKLDKVTGGTEMKAGQVPSTSVGQMSGSTSRQTTNDSLATKIVGGAG